jgi:PilZ domain
MIEASPQNRRRSQRVLLQIAVLVRAQLLGGQEFHAQGFTLAVSAHGGLLEAPMRLLANQKIKLANPQTGREVNCRVVRVDGPVEQTYKIAFEFEAHNPQFWAITFPPVDWAMSKEPEHETR